MLLAYVDESGNTGAIASGGSLTFSLGCVLLDADQWPDAFDQLLNFRRRLRSTYGLPMRAEIKANYLLRNNGPFRKLGLGLPSAALYIAPTCEWLRTFPLELLPLL